MINEEAIKEIKDNIQRLEKTKEKVKDNKIKVNAIENELEVNRIALRLMMVKKLNT